MRYTSREARECSPQNKEGYIFTIKKKKEMRGEKTTIFLILGQISRLISLVPRLTLYGLTGTITL